jgi:hypothetical protein
VTIEAKLFTVLGPLASNRVYPDIAPENTTLPYVTYQQIGGQAIQYLENTRPVQRRTSFQINVWAATRVAAAALAEQIATALLADVELATAIDGEPTARFEEETGLRGTMQDFTFFY